jgi:hypothetical protein
MSWRRPILYAWSVLACPLLGWLAFLATPDAEGASGDALIILVPMVLAGAAALMLVRDARQVVLAITVALIASGALLVLAFWALSD